MADYKGAVDLRHDLYEVADETVMSLVRFSADEILPEISVKDPAAYYPTLPTGTGMKKLDLRRQARGTFTRGKWVYDSKMYSTHEYGYEEPVDKVEALANEDIFDEEVVSSQIATSQLKIAREQRVADATFNTTTFAAAADKHAAAVAWDVPGTADPYTDIDNAYEKLFKKIGIEKAMCDYIMTEAMFRKIIRSDAVRADAKYTVTMDKLNQAEQHSFFRDLLGIGRLILVSSFADATQLGITDAEFNRMWDSNYGMLTKLSPKVNSWKVPGLGRQPVWTKYAKDYRIESYPEPQSDAIIVRAREYRGEQVDPQYGVLLTGLAT